MNRTRGFVNLNRFKFSKAVKGSTRCAMSYDKYEKIRRKVVRAKDNKGKLSPK